MAEPGRDGARQAVARMLSGDMSESQCVEFLGALASRGETDGELLGMLDAMDEFVVSAGPAGEAIDVCGTGGDGAGTFNVSTAASFVAAAAGCQVAKHGNRSSSGATGSADVFEALGCDLDAGPERARELLAKHGICFMFAPRFHPAMKRVAGARRKLGGRTAFNIVGPLANPAGVRAQLVGVGAGFEPERMARLLQVRGARAAMSVCSADGDDELVTSCPCRYALRSESKTESGAISAADVGLSESNKSEILVHGSGEALRVLVGAIDGTAARAVRETAAFNAGAGLFVAGKASSVMEGVETALDAVSSGAASKKLDRFVADAGNTEALEAIRNG